MVSVPWVTTTPAAPLPSTPLIAAASSKMSPKVRDAPGLRRKSTVRSSASMPSRPGTAASSSGADRAGDTPPPGACVMAIVPPRPKTATNGPADSRIGGPSRLTAGSGLPGRRQCLSSGYLPPASQPNAAASYLSGGKLSQRQRRDWRVVVGQAGHRCGGSWHLPIAAGQVGANGPGQVRQVREHREEGVVALRGQRVELQRDGDRGKGLGTGHRV